MTTSNSGSTSHQYETILFNTNGHIAYITLNRPSVLNAQNEQMGLELSDAWAEFDSDPDLWVAILSGAGRAFSSGADYSQRHLLSPQERMSRRTQEWMDKAPLQTVNWKPVIAAVHGYAFGLGLGLTLACDLTVAAEGTQFQITEVQRGTGGGHHWVQAWFCGGGRFANELALTGRRFTAAEALQIGMINRIVPAADLMTAAEELAGEIIQNPPLSVRCNARVMRHFMSDQMGEAIYYEGGLRQSLRSSEDFLESARAFVEKRSAVVKGQ